MHLNGPNAQSDIHSWENIPQKTEMEPQNHPIEKEKICFQPTFLSMLFSGVYTFPQTNIAPEK